MVNPFRQELQNREGGGSSNPFRRELERREMPTARSAPEQPRMRRSPERTGPGESDTGFLDFAGETLKFAGSVIGSGVTEVAAGYEGLLGLIYGAFSGDTTPIEQAVRNIENVRADFSYVPEEGASRDALEAIGRPLSVLDRGAERAGGATADILGPEAGAATYTALSFLPDLMAGPVNRGAGRAARIAARRRTERELKALGVRPRSSREDQVSQISEAGRRLEGGSVRGEGFEGAAEVAQAEFARLENLENQAWERLREMGREDDTGRLRAWVNPQDLRPIREPVESLINEYPLDDMGRLRGRVNRLYELMDQEGRIPLSDLVTYRKTLNKLPTDRAEAGAIIGLKGVLDRYLINDFNTSAISGDPQAIQRWRDALGQSTELNNVFPRGSVIRQLAKQEATPEEMRQWLFGANSMLPRKNTKMFLDQIKSVVGENSPQWNAIRKDGLLDLLEPLTQDQPNLGQFIRNYDRLIRRNNTVATELYGDSLEPLRTLRDAAVAARRAGAKEAAKLQIGDNAIRALFGHELSAGQARMNVFRTIWQHLKNIKEPGRRRRFMGEMMGYDAFDPVLPRNIMTIEGAREASEEATQEDTEEEGQQR